MNKNIKRFVSVLLAVLLVTALGVSALAEDGELYTVRVYAGNVEGANINGQSVWTYTGSYGETIPFDYRTMVSLPEGSQYSVRGVRKSGYDNNQISPLGTITEDADYVIAYGITGQLVSYTVNFVDAAGNALAASQTYYGNVGDKPVVAYLYIDGYEPQAYNLARTLTENEAANVFDFVYTPVVVPTPIPAAPAPTPYVFTEGAEGGGAAAGGGLPAAAGGVELPGAGGEAAVEGEEVPEAGGPAEAGGEPAAEGEEPAPAEQETAAEQEPETAEIVQDESPQANAPAEYIDLDDTPSGEKPEIKEKPETEMQQERNKSQHNLFISVGLLGVSFIAIVTLVVLLMRRRKV